MISTLYTALLTCAALAADKPAQLAPAWAPVCIEVAMRAPQYDVPPALAVTTAWCESQMHHAAVGAAGEVGPMQCNIVAHGVACLRDPVGEGLRVLRDLLIEQDGDWHAATCRYTGDGPRCTRRRAAMARRLVAMVTP